MSPKRLLAALVLSFRCPSRQDEPPQTSLSKVLGLAPDYRRKMHIFLPLARAPETHPFLLSHALALAAAVPPRFFLVVPLNARCPLVLCCTTCLSVQGFGARRTLGLFEQYPRSTRLPRSSGNILLRPIRIEHEKIRHWRLPLVTGGLRGRCKYTINTFALEVVGL